MKKQTQIVKQKISEENRKIPDTTSHKERIFVPKSVLADTVNPDLKFASSLLDTFLIRHPEYSSLILQQEAKDLVWNKNINKYSRLALEQRINDEIHKYLREKFPEGSEHEINKYTGPGLQIPIDDLIDKIKNLFK